MSLYCVVRFNIVGDCDTDCYGFLIGVADECRTETPMVVLMVPDESTRKPGPTLDDCETVRLGPAHVELTDIDEFWLFDSSEGTHAIDMFFREELPRATVIRDAKPYPCPSLTVTSVMRRHRQEREHQMMRIQSSAREQAIVSRTSALKDERDAAREEARKLRDWLDETNRLYDDMVISHQKTSASLGKALGRVRRLESENRRLRAVKADLRAELAAVSSQEIDA